MTDDSKGSNAVTVRIGGEDHVIRAKVEPEYTVRCAEWVDGRISEIRGQVGLLEKHKVAILAALSITDELFRAQKELEQLREIVVHRVEAQSHRLEKALSAEVGE